MNVIRFCLNGQWIEERDIDPNCTILHFLRTNKMQVAAKEGCASGDCGACSILVAELNSKGPFHYQAINSCIALLGSLHGKYVVTVEGLKQNGEHHPVQQAMIDKHGSQCGFCTPGIVSALTALHFNQSHNQHTSASEHDVHVALSGNLCRCTGYRSIMDAAAVMFDYPAPKDNSIINQGAVVTFDPQHNKQSLQPSLENEGRYLYVPETENELKDLLQAYPQAKLWAGGTDLGLEITQQFKQFDHIISLHRIASLKVVNESVNEIRIGSMLTYSESEAVFANNFPSLVQLIERIGSRQIRNLGTLGGNVANGSPIGDMPPVFFALNARLEIACKQGVREIKIEDFYQGYKKTDLKPGEYLKTIVLPKLTSNQSLHIFKISKRKDDDISAVMMACVIGHDGKNITHANIACGGMAATPLHAVRTQQALKGKAFELTSFQQASDAIMQDYSPIQDVRASKEYRLTVAKNLVIKTGIECLGGQ